MVWERKQKQDILQMKAGFTVEYSDDLEEVCVIPSAEGIPLLDCKEIFELFVRLGYERWVPTTDTLGYTLRKKAKL